MRASAPRRRRSAAQPSSSASSTSQQPSAAKAPATAGTSWARSPPAIRLPARRDQPRERGRQRDVGGRQEVREDERRRGTGPVRRRPPPTRARGPPRRCAGRCPPSRPPRRDRGRSRPPAGRRGAAAAIARMPEPQPTSSAWDTRAPASARSRSSRQLRVDPWPPVPKARPGSISTTTRPAASAGGGTSHGGHTSKPPPHRERPEVGAPGVGPRLVGEGRDVDARRGARAAPSAARSPR